MSFRTEYSKVVPRPQSRPTDFNPEITRIADNEAAAKRLAKVIRELLQERRFSTPSELRDAVEDRCAELKLTTTSDQMHRAMDLVGSNTQLFAANQRRRLSKAPSVPERPPLSHAEAKTILAEQGIDVSGGRFRMAGKTPKTSRLEPW